jgi:hypothetical protein
MAPCSRCSNASALLRAVRLREDEEEPLVDAFER